MSLFKFMFIGWYFCVHVQWFMFLSDELSDSIRSLRVQLFFKVYL